MKKNNKLSRRNPEQLSNTSFDATNALEMGALLTKAQAVKSTTSRSRIEQTNFDEVVGRTFGGSVNAVTNKDRGEGKPSDLAFLGQEVSFNGEGFNAVGNDRVQGRIGVFHLGGQQQIVRSYGEIMGDGKMHLNTRDKLFLGACTLGGLGMFAGLAFFFYDLLK